MAKFWQKKYTSRYTGAEIDAAVAKAGTVPAVTEADAGKALVVDDDGKIVTGSNTLPVIQFTQLELLSILTDFMTHIISATDKLTVKQFTITGDVVAGLIEKVHTITESPKRCGYLQIEGFSGNMFVCVGNDDTFQSMPVRVIGSTPTNYNTQLWLLINVSDTTAVRINAFVQKVNVAS